MKRLQTRPQFQAVLNAPAVAKSAHFVMHRLDTKLQPSESSAQTLHALPLFDNAVWLGAMIPKRWAKRAVTRNALKRQVYVVGASLERQFSCAAYLVRLRAEFSRQLFQSASSESLKTAARLELVDLIKMGLQAKG